MVLKISLAAAMLLAGVNAASACLASPETTHNRELALIYSGLKKVTLKPDDLAAVKKLEAQAERRHRARNFEQAQKARHAALIRIGYRYEPAKPSVDPPPPQGAQGVPPGGAKTGGLAPPNLPTSRGCGGDGGTWVAPSSWAGRQSRTR